MKKQIRYVLVLLLTSLSSWLNAQTNILNVGNATVVQGGTVELPIILNNESQVAGGQFTVLLPDGVTLDQVTMDAARSNGHAVEYRMNTLQNGILILFYASPTASINGDTGTLLNLSLDVPSDYPVGNFDVTIEPDVLLTPDGISRLAGIAVSSGVLTVDKLIIPVSSITIATEENITEITPTRTTLHLTATLLPENATDKSFTWSIVEGEDLVNLTPEGILSANESNKNGTVVVSATAGDGSGTYGKLTITVKDFIAVGTTKHSLKNIQLYPAPVKNLLSIKGIPNNEEYSIIVYNMMGGIVYTGKGFENSFSLDCSNYPRGFYLIKIVAGNGNINSYRIMKE